MTRQADRNAERQDPKGLGPEGMRAAVCEADAPNTSPMDKTVEVSQAARDAAAVDAAKEYPRFCTWLKNHLPGVESSPTSHLFDAWMASAREATIRATPSKPPCRLCGSTDCNCPAVPRQVFRSAGGSCMAINESALQPTTRATQPEAALREAEAKLEFTRGYLLAVANVMHTHDEDVIATDVLAELGEKEGAIKRCGFDDYDAKPLRKLFREMKRRNAYCRARAALKDHRHG